MQRTASVVSVRHPVIEEILRRRSRPNDAAQTTRLGLVVEGGGMRGVYSGGALLGLADLGLSSVFDEVYAESAGAVNACYFLSGQAHLGIRVYTEDLQSTQFINPMRTDAILNVDYVVDEVVKRRKALHTEPILRSRTDLLIAITNALDGSSRMVDIKRDGLSLFSVLKATMAIVPLYNRPVLIGGVPYVDGGISNPIPVVNAVAAGCTHILALLSRPAGYSHPDFTRVQRFILSLMLRKWGTELQHTFHYSRPTLYRKARELIFGNGGERAGVQIAVIAPEPESPVVSRLTLRRSRLRAAIRDAVARTTAVFES